MDDLLQKVKDLFTFSDVNIDNLPFKLFSKVGVASCLLGAFLCFSTTYIGDPIVCAKVGRKSITDDLMKSHCWIHGSYHLTVDRTKFHGNLPGYCNVVDEEGDENPDTSYYQWVVFMLVIHAGIFMIPSAVWKLMEGGLMAEFGTTAKSPTIMADKEALDGTIKTYLDFFKVIQGGENKVYMGKFFFCEFLNILALLTNFALVDKFLQGKFWSYGTEVMRYQSMDSAARLGKVDPTCSVFPTTVTCSLYSMSLTGDFLPSDNALCILNQNIINEKIYLALWFLFYIMLAVSFIVVVEKILWFTVPSVSKKQVSGNFRHCNNYVDDYLMSTLTLGDKFVLRQLRSNCHSRFFEEFIRKLAQRTIRIPPQHVIAITDDVSLPLKPIVVDRPDNEDISNRMNDDTESNCGGGSHRRREFTPPNHQGEKNREFSS